MEGRESAAAGSWLLSLLVLPAVVVAGTAGAECLGANGLVVLVPTLAVWAFLLVRGLRRNRARLGPKLGFLAVTALAILLLRPADPERISDDLAEVLLRELLETPRDRVYYVEVDGTDPSPALLRRLSDLGVRLKPGSKAMIGGRDYPGEEFDRASRDNVKGRDTGAYGTILRVGHLRRERSYILVPTVEIDASSYSGLLWGGGARYMVTYLGRWWITGTTEEWES